jgi:hypothetical protein
LILLQRTFPFTPIEGKLKIIHPNSNNESSTTRQLNEKSTIIAVPHQRVFLSQGEETKERVSPAGKPKLSLYID